MNQEKMKEILAKYDIAFDPMAMDTLMAISHLPTSEIFDLFNDIAVEDVFSPKIKTRLF